MSIKKLTKDVEKVSQLYAHEHHINRNDDWFILKLQEELGELIKSYLMITNRARRKGQSEDELNANFREEMADVFGHILLLAHHMNIDLEKEFTAKWLTWLK